MSECFSNKLQSNQLNSLFWQYALLFPYCVLRTSSPIKIMGVPNAINATRKFFTCLLRRNSVEGSSVGPSIPQFQLRLSLFPSRFCSRFASLCLQLYDTRSLRVKPSWQVMKLML